MTATRTNIEGLSEADRALVLEARAPAPGAAAEAPVSETLERRMKSELGVEPEEEAGLRPQPADRCVGRLRPPGDLVEVDRPGHRYLQVSGQSVFSIPPST